MKRIKDTLLNIVFPKFCLGCNREESYLCEDCKACLDISENNFCLCDKPKILPQNGKCEKCISKNLDGLYSAVSYQKPLVRKLINEFRNSPYIKELSKPFADLITSHFLLLERDKNLWEGKIIIPLSINKKEFKARGYNPAEEIAKNLSITLKIPIYNYLIKEGSSFLIKENIENKKILLVNDLYTDGIIMNEAARILKKAKAKEVKGVVVARGFD